MRRWCSFPFLAKPRYESAQVTISTIGAEIARPSFDLSFGFILVTMMLFSIYAFGGFIKAKVQARKRILLPASIQEVQEGPSLLPTQPHKIIVTGYKSVAGGRY
jgi:hypothetical protein